jgi:hypothetical protein
MEDYYTRIFSRPIIDKTFNTKMLKKKVKNTLNTNNKKSQFIDSELDSDSEKSDSDSESECSAQSEQSESEFNSDEDSDTEVATECQITEELIDDLDNIELYDEPDEPDEYDYNE